MECWLLYGVLVVWGAGFFLPSPCDVKPADIVLFLTILSALSSTNARGEIFFASLHVGKCSC